MPKVGGARPGAGRPKGSVITQHALDLRELCRKHAPAVVEMLLHEAMHGENAAARVAAGRELLDRGYGKPVQAVEATVKTEAREMNRAELLAIIAAEERDRRLEATKEGTVH